MMRYSDEHYMRTHKNVDFHSLQQAVDKALSLGCDISSSQKNYYWRYDEELNHLSNLAGFYWNDLERLAYSLGEYLPLRSYKFMADDDFMGSGIIWFNHAIACLPDSNLITALVNEEDNNKLYGDTTWENIDYKLRQARMNAIQKLKKEDLLLLLASSCGMIAKVAELQAEAAMLVGLIDELEYQHNAIVAKDGSVIHHPASGI